MSRAFHRSSILTSISRMICVSVLGAATAVVKFDATCDPTIFSAIAGNSWKQRSRETQRAIGKDRIGKVKVTKRRNFCLVSTTSEYTETLCKTEKYGKPRKRDSGPF